MDVFESEVKIKTNQTTPVVKFKDTDARGTVARGSALQLGAQNIPRECLNRVFVAKVTSGHTDIRYFNATARSNKGSVIVQLGMEKKYESIRVNVRSLEDKN